MVLGLGSTFNAHVALRCTPPCDSESYEYLRDFALHFDGDQSLAIRPNFSFSLALAALRREQQQQQRQQQQRQQASAAEVRAAEAARRGAGPKSSGVGSKGGGKDGVSAGGGDQAAGGDTKGAQEQSALQLMVAAVMLHPSVVPRLQRWGKQGAPCYVETVLARALQGAGQAPALGVAEFDAQTRIGHASWRAFPFCALHHATRVFTKCLTCKGKLRIES
eukprot:119072-Pelagomonas_calceolata.AAC.3